jgi:hypothetical protein
VSNHRQEIEARVAATTAALLQHVRDEDRLAVVQAPPGSGKTYLLLSAVREAYQRKQRVAVATQTRSQADDICRRIGAPPFSLPAIRFVARGGVRTLLPNGIQAVEDHKCLPREPCIVVGTTAKWGLIELRTPFDVVFVEEAWQMDWADFMLLGQVAARFVLIGDPGQIPPVVSVDASRWETAPRPPQRPAPELILRERRRDALCLQLPATRRLPHDTATLINPFYDFPFGAWAEPGDRRLSLTRRDGRHGLDAALEMLASGTVVGVTLPTPPGGPPLECDEEIATVAVDVAHRLLTRQTEILFDGTRERLTPEQIGLSATHHVMNAAMALRLNGELSRVGIDTPERWQGLERRVMVIVHPLSGVTRPSAFDLETGRLCVMASRHQVGLVVVTRDHLTETLETHLPVADQALGRPDVSGRGHHQNWSFWHTLQERGKVAPVPLAL